MPLKILKIVSRQMRGGRRGAWAGKLLVEGSVEIQAFS